jgi:hypothetical protein
MTALEEDRLKGMLKKAMVEVLEERGDLLRDALEEGLEEIAMIRAIQEGEKTSRISRKHVFQRLEKAV